MTIDYICDRLNRLTEANYSTGDHYHYGYDEVGNRKAQETELGGLIFSDTYNYDSANRLLDVNGVTYSWDNNGNLLNDGTNTYTYDSANRLSSVTNSQLASSYAYNGLGDRLRQTVDGLPTNYTLDLNMGLTQVLSDGTNTFYYGADRIAQKHGASLDYFLGDALGSVRQLTDANGLVMSGKSYEPYGEVRASWGDGATAYGFTGEQTDVTGMVYLRARYYTPEAGRFITHDTWAGDYQNPLTQNAWNYTSSNPINRIDPSGMCYTDPNKLSYGYWSRFFEKPMFRPCTTSTSQPNNPPAPSPTTTPVLIGYFNLSGYYTTAEAQSIWAGGPIPILSDPSKTNLGKYLSVINGRYTNDLSQAQTAKRDFLQSGSGVCMQGSGKLINGGIIHCSRTEPVFEWGSLGNVQAFNTAARCQWSNLLRSHDIIYVDAPWFRDFLAKHGNPTGFLEVTDVGQAPGLCNSNGHEGIDIYLGEGQAAYDAWLEFVSLDSANEYQQIWWPIYRK